MHIVRPLRILIAASVVLLLIGYSPIGHSQVTPRETPVEYDRALMAKARENGVVPVIVGLKLPEPFRVEGQLAGPQQVREQREAIRATQDELLKSLSEHDVTAYTAYRYIPYMALQVDEAALKALIASPLVTSIDEDVAVPPSLASTTPLIGADVVWGEGFEGSGWTVAVLDTGVQWDHDFFGGIASSRVVTESCYSDGVPANGRVSLCPNTQISQTTGHAADPTITNCYDGETNMCAHGTHVAGIAAGDGTSYDGVARGADIIAIQVFTRFNKNVDCGGPGTAPCVLTWSSDQIDGLERVYALRTTYDIAAVNMSLGGGYYNDYCDSDSRKAIVDTLWSAGIATVIATGNDGYTDAIGKPACISTAVAVGATTDSDTVASFSNSSTLVDLLAPGVDVDSAVPDNTYGNYQGTSMAAPHVAGAWALLKSVASSATVTDVLDALQDTGISVTDTRNSITKPRIQLDAAAAVVGAATWTGGTTSWNTAGNWSTGRVPSRIANVTIPASPIGENYPTVDADATVYDLTVASGAELNMSANTFNVYGDWLVTGSGFYNATGGTAAFKCSRDQTIQMTGNANDHFYHLQIGDGSTSQTVTADSDLDVDGNLTIMSGASLAGGSNTINVVGNWTDNGRSFVSGTSTVLLDGDTQAVQTGPEGTVLFEDFSERDGGPSGTFYPTPPSGWAVVNDGAANSLPWLFGYSSSPPNSPDTGGHTRHIWNPDYPGLFDTWLFTPGLALSDHDTHRLEFKYGARSASYPETLEVHIGTGQTPGDMTTVLSTSTNIVNTSWNTATITFTVPSAGTYHIGFRTYGDPDATWDLALDDIRLTAIGDITFYNLTVNSTGTGATFSNDVRVNNNLTIGSGAMMDVGTHEITDIGGTFTNNGTLSHNESKTISSGGSETFLDAQGANAARITHVSGDVPGDTTVTTRVGSTAPSNAFGAGCPAADSAVLRYYNINAADNDGLNVTLRLYYADSELNGNTEGSLKIWHCEGGIWVDNGGTVNESGNYVEATAISSFSPFVLGGSPTSVQAGSFTASPTDSGVRLQWETASEMGLLGFDLYRATSPVGPKTQLNGSLIPCQAPGSPMGAMYTYLDETVVPGMTYHYWLEEVGVRHSPTSQGPISVTAQTSMQYDVYLPLVLK